MHRHFKPAKGVDSSLSVGDIVVIHDENLPRGLWKLGTVEELMVGADGNVRSAKVKVTSGDRNSISIKRPLQRLYQLELCSEDKSEQSTEGQEGQTDCEMPSTTLDQDQDESAVRETVMERQDRDIEPSEQPKIISEYGVRISKTVFGQLTVCMHTHIVQCPKGGVC